MASSSNKPNSKAGLKTLLEDPDIQQDLLTFFARKAGLETTEEVLPTKKVRDVDAESAAPKLQKGIIDDASRKPAEKTNLASLEAKTGTTPSLASDLLAPFAGISILYKVRRSPSTYIPSSQMMFYIIHIMNDVLSDSRNFCRACPDFHPYVFRLYCGILFWVQCLRVGANNALLNGADHQFLLRFLDSHPLESLPIPSPLLLVFKSLCASQPEIGEYGPVCPILPDVAGPQRRSNFCKTTPDAYLLPNVPCIFALLRDLNAKINGNPPIYPSKYSHDTVGDAETTFGFHNFPAQAEREIQDQWSLITPGIEYPCEASRKIHEVFSERYATFHFPTLTANDDLTTVAGYLSMHGRTDWFGRVKDVAAMVSEFFKNSGTLADCAVSGPSANQYLIGYRGPDVLPTAPTKVADPASLFPFSFKLATSVRKSSQVAIAEAGLVQTNVVMFDNHPYFHEIGDIDITRFGDFWSIEPVEFSSYSAENYLAIRPIIKAMFDTKS